MAAQKPMRQRSKIRGHGFSLLLSGVLACIAARAHAESMDGSSSSLDAGVVPVAFDAGDVVAPRVIALAELDRQTLDELGARPVLVVIRRDGTALLEACPLSIVGCDALRAGLAASRFEPARNAGETLAARVKLRFSAAPDAGTPAHEAARHDFDAAITDPAQSDAALPHAAAQDAASEETGEYGATASVLAPAPGAIAVSLEQMREVPGAFGDPFRVLEALPGVVPLISGLPYVYVRGAPPAGTAYIYDDIQLPTLFHFALGPGVIHPAMIGAVDFYPGVAPARYGRKTGGTLAGRGSSSVARPGTHGELELRPIDLQAYVSSSFKGGSRVELGGRYGYPGPLARLFDKRTGLQYWDYQLRASTPVGVHSELSLVALGSYDLIGERTKAGFQRDIELQFHRVEARAVRRGRGVSVGGALGAGYEKSGIGEDIDISIARLGPKLWLEVGLGKAHLRIGADALTSIGHVKDETSRTVTDAAGNEVTREGTGRLGSYQDPRYANARSRSVLGAYAELAWPFAKDWSLDLGLRGDAWITGPDTQLALEPRLLLRHQTTDTLTLHAAGGLAYQPAAFPIPLPGIADVVLQPGLQRAIQSELGAELQLDKSWSAELKLFTNFYDGIISFESLANDTGGCSSVGSPPPAQGIPDDGSGAITPQVPIDEDGSAECKRRGTPRTSSTSYGAELMLRRSYSERLSGWLAYTLSKAHAFAADGTALRPNYDVRHVMNLVLQWRVNPRWHLSVRGYVQSGRYPLGEEDSLDPRERQRLPSFFRGDLQIARVWKRSWGELRFSFDWLNFTFQKEPSGWECNDPAVGGKCKVETVGFPITVPMLGVRGSY